MRHDHSTKRTRLHVERTHPIDLVPRRSRAPLLMSGANPMSIRVLCVRIVLDHKERQDKRGGGHCLRWPHATPGGGTPWCYDRRSHLGCFQHLEMRLMRRSNAMDRIDAFREIVCGGPEILMVSSPCCPQFLTVNVAVEAALRLYGECWLFGTYGSG